MALTTQTMTENRKSMDDTPEYYTAIDHEGKGYLAKRKVVVEEPIVEEKPVIVKKKVNRRKRK